MAKKKEIQPIIIIKKKGGHGGHHGGAWKVAFADFMTALFALFLVLWLVNQSSDVKSAIAGYFQDPLGRADEFGSSIMPGDGAQSQMVRRPMVSDDILALSIDRLERAAKNISKEFEGKDGVKDLLDHIEITQTDEGLQIELLENENGFFFQKGMPVPSEEGSRILARLAPEIGAIHLPVRIEGHTDAYGFKSLRGYTNWELSADRANATRRILTANGVEPDQIVGVRALAATRPKVPDDPYSPKNRRITITLLTNLNPPGDSAD